MTSEDAAADAGGNLAAGSAAGSLLDVWFLVQHLPDFRCHVAA